MTSERDQNMQCAVYQEVSTGSTASEQKPDKASQEHRPMSAQNRMLTLET